MYITEFTLENVRCFEGTHTVSLARGLEGDANYAGWTVVAGRNGAGKTSLLRALALSLSRPGDAIVLERACDSWIHLDAAVGYVRASVFRDITLDQLASNLLLEADDGWTPVAPDLDRTESEVEWRASSAGRVLSGNELPLPSAMDEGIGWFVCGYGPFRHIGPAGNDAHPRSRRLRFACLLHLFFEGASLIDAIDWLQHLHLRALEGHHADEVLKRQILALLNDGLLPDGSRVQKVDSDGLWIERDGFTAPVQRISDGYRAVTALVLDLVRHLRGCYGDQFELVERDGHVVCDMPGVVLIDEVDAHMHVSWQQRFGFWMREHFPRIQFIVTTHSPFVCQAASPRGIIRLPGPGEDRRIEHVSERAFKQLVNGSIDEAVMSELFGLEHPHSDETEDLRDRLAELEKRVLLGQELTPEQEAEMERLRGQLPDTIGDRAEQQFRAASHS